jgi:hypothetical protein
MHGVIYIYIKLYYFYLDMCNLSKNNNFGPLFTILDLLFEPLMHGFLMQHTEVNIMKKKVKVKKIHMYDSFDVLLQCEKLLYSLWFKIITQNWMTLAIEGV